MKRQNRKPGGPTRARDLVPPPPPTPVPRMYSGSTYARYRGGQALGGGGYPAAVNPATPRLHTGVLGQHRMGAALGGGRVPIGPPTLPGPAYGSKPRLPMVVGAEGTGYGTPAGTRKGNYLGQHRMGAALGGGRAPLAQPGPVFGSKPRVSAVSGSNRAGYRQPPGTRKASYLGRHRMGAALGGGFHRSLPPPPTRGARMATRGKAMAKWVAKHPIKSTGALGIGLGVATVMSSSGRATDKSAPLSPSLGGYGGRGMYVHQ